MSDNLRKFALKLIKLSKLRTKEVKEILKTASRKLINVLSEIAYNAREGVFKVVSRLRNSKLIKTLSDKKTKLETKRLILRSVAASFVVKALLKAATGVLSEITHG